MLKVKVIRLDKTGNIKEYTMKFKDTKSNNLEIEKLADADIRRELLKATSPFKNLIEKFDYKFEKV